MPHKHRAPRRRNRRNSDTAYRPPCRPRRALQAGRHAGRHTRSRWAGPLYQGLQHERATRIAEHGFAAIARFTDVEMPAVPMLHTFGAPSERTLRPWPVATQPASSDLYQVFSMPHLRTNIMSGLNRAEQDNVRLMSRQMAGIVPAFHTLSGKARTKQSKSIRCQNRPFPGRMVRLAPPGTLGNVTLVWPMQTTPRHQCTRTAITDPNIRFEVCDGTRLGLNPNNQHHPATFTICYTCADDAFMQYLLSWNYGERTLPLCYTCSADEIYSKTRYECPCDLLFMPLPYRQVNPRNRYFLCSDCRRAFADRVIRVILSRVEQQLQLCPRTAIPPNATPWEKLRCYIYDTDPANRNHCKCGLNYIQIFGTYPRRANTLGTNNWSWLYRMCLACGHHVAHHNPRPRISTCY